MMRVLVVHNRYRSAMPSGENRVVDRDVAALRAAGAEVRTYIRESDDIAGFSAMEKAELTLRPIYSRSDTREITRLLDEWRPHVIHFHNAYPLISPGFIRQARRRHIPVVQTVHNYRHVCLNGLFSRDGQPCHDCVGHRVAVPAARHGCYRESRPQSVVMALAQAVNRPSVNGIERFIAVSPTVGRFLVDDVGIAPDQVVVRPNSLPDPGPVVPPSGRGLLFVGRLEEIKGVSLLIGAWDAGAPPGWHLTIAGDGPSRAEVEAFAERRDDVTFTGPVASAEVRRLMDASRAIIVPSVWYEAMPMVVVEAFSRGRPVLGTGHGALADLIDPTVGWLCDPTVDDLAARLNDVAQGPIPEPSVPRERFDERYRGDEAAEWLLAQYRALSSLGVPDGPDRE